MRFEISEFSIRGVVALIECFSRSDDWSIERIDDRVWVVRWLKV